MMAVSNLNKCLPRKPWSKSNSLINMLLPIHSLPRKWVAKEGNKPTSESVIWRKRQPKDKRHQATTLNRCRWDQVLWLQLPRKVPPRTRKSRKDHNSTLDLIASSLRKCPNKRKLKSSAKITQTCSQSWHQVWTRFKTLINLSISSSAMIHSLASI